eukprot:TRINITY_DN17759_c0_g1_i2.p1 TRINITY_DN17759_c0_g1~~TRINITY_DN17759_c0_g1_i2.p1  ORF type:complete len:331 (+),score=43.37 TRINITY_DN17759_c0_g1_i2:67-993(+)
MFFFSSWLLLLCMMMMMLLLVFPGGVWCQVQSVSVDNMGRLQVAATDMMVRNNSMNALFQRVPLINDYFNVRMYGAKGDGVADDTQSFRDTVSAIVAARPSRGATFYIPAGEYRLTGTISFSAGATQVYLNIVGDGAGSLLTWAHTANLIEIAAPMAKFLNIRDLLITPTVTTLSTSFAFLIYTPLRASIERVSIYQTPSTWGSSCVLSFGGGFYLKDPSDVYMSKIRIDGASGNGIVAEDGSLVCYFIFYFIFSFVIFFFCSFCISSFCVICTSLIICISSSSLISHLLASQRAMLLGLVSLISLSG